MRLDVLKAMNSARAERRAAAVVTRLADGEQRFVPAERVDADPLRLQLEAALRMGKSAAVSVEIPWSPRYESVVRRYRGY